MFLSCSKAVEGAYIIFLCVWFDSLCPINNLSVI